MATGNVGIDTVDALLPLLGNFGTAGIGLWMFIRGVLCTGKERDQWRQAYEQERDARSNLEKALAVEIERAATAVENAKVSRQLLVDLKKASVAKEISP